MTGTVTEQRRGNQGVHLCGGKSVKQRVEPADQVGFLAEEFGEFTPQPGDSQRVPGGEIQGAKGVIQELSGEVNQRQTVKAAGHGTIIVEQTATVRVQENTGSVIILRHDPGPLLLGAVGKEVGRGKLRPDFPNPFHPFPSLPRDVRPDRLGK